jgi:MFS transporter, SP family, galactose:H+ symporter
VLIAGTALSAAAPGTAALLVGRAVVGLGVGAASSTVPLYLSELAPPGRRGRLVTLNQLMVVSGILVAYGVDLLFASSESWRSMFAVGLVPAAALLVGMLGAPESPAWLETRGRDREGRPTLRELAGSPARAALIVGVALAVAQQLSGINAVISYAPSIMERTGLSASSSILYSVIVGAVNLAATVVSIGLVDRAGRRPLLLASLAGTAVSLALLGLSFEVEAASWLSLACLLAFIIAFAVGIGPIFWLLIAEIFPPQTRAAGVAVCTAVNWFANFAVGLAFLPLAGALGQGAVFWIFAAVCAAACAFAARSVPETKGRSFPEIDAELRARIA